MSLTRILGTVLASLFAGVAVGQSSPEAMWTVVTSEAGRTLPLPGATVSWSCDGQLTHTLTDLQGRFLRPQEALDCGQTCSVTVRFVGYVSQTLDCSALPASGRMKVVMEPNTEALSEAVVTASIRGSTVAEETVPVAVLKPYLAQSANALDLKGLVAKTPGVSILDGQVSIRGGSGYSYGVGSRVQMLLDGLPLLSGDLGEIWWSYLPMEHVDQVEVVKSSASAMYGSGASNGVIHMRTAWPGDTSETRVSVFNGVYQAPDSANWRWWRDSYTPVSNGMDVSHRQGFGKVDVVAGGSVFSDKTYLSVGHEQRLRGHLKARWKPSSTWQIGGAVQAQYQQMGRFILWDDFATSAYLPMEGTSSEDRWINWHADAWASCTPEEGGSHHLQTRVYQTSRYGSGPEPSMTSTLSMLQYRHVREVGEHGLAQAGAFASAQSSFSSLYPDIELLTFNPAVFAQFDWERDRWKWTAGVRAEANENPGFYSESSGPTFRFGVNRGLGERTRVRLSYGESLRFASIAERYVEGTLTDGINIRGNLDLQNESGNNWEMGLVHEIKSGDQAWVLDASAFVLNYDDMIEYTLQAETDSMGSIVIVDGVPQFFFQPLNLGKTRIAGVEGSVVGQGRVGRVPVRVVAGGTFNYAGDLVSDPAQDSLHIFVQNMVQSMGSSRDSLVAAGSLLKYRNKGSLKVDVEWDMGPWTAGVALNHESFIDAVDWYFEELVSGLVNYREQFTDGARRWDARLTYRAPKGQRFSLVVNNLNNAVLSNRPGIMAPPRHVMLRFDTRF